MPSIRERSIAPPKRLIVRIAIAIGFVMAIYLYAVHVTARSKAREESVGHILSLLAKGDAPRALADAVSAQRGYGNSPTLARATWAALMAGGGRHGRTILLRRTFAFTARDPRFSLMFSKDGRFLAALDGNSITVWNVENGRRVLTTAAGDRFVGYWRIEAHHFGLLASYQFYDLVNDVIAVPDSYRYAQPAKDSLTGVAPGGDWAYHVPKGAAGRTDYPIKLINLHTGEKREVDVGYQGEGSVAVNIDGTRIANVARVSDGVGVHITDARHRRGVGGILSRASQLYFSKALNALISANASELNLWDADNGAPLAKLFVPNGLARAVADDPRGLWFAVQTGQTVRLYRGLNSPVLSAISEKEISPAPATSH